MSQSSVRRQVAALQTLLPLPLTTQSRRSRASTRQARQPAALASLLRSMERTSLLDRRYSGMGLVEPPLLSAPLSSRQKLLPPTWPPRARPTLRFSILRLGAAHRPRLFSLSTTQSRR